MHKEIRLKINRDIELRLKYIWNNRITSIIAFYFIISVFLKSIFDIDIRIPCIWKNAFGFQCPGCGITSAFNALIKLNINKAYHSNALLFVVLPIGIYSLILDFKKFKKTTTQHIKNE